MPVLQVRVRIGEQVPLDVLCAGYELKSWWRAEALVEDLLERHLLTFALNFREERAVTSSTALRSIREAALSVYTSDKYQRRGEFGEMLLHGALVDFYGAIPAVSKIYYEDSTNDVVKGFDSVHVVADLTGTTIWLGEAKFYEDLSGAISSVLEDVQKHLAADFLRQEFIFITRKVDDQWPHAEAFRSLVEKSRSLDEIASAIVMPVFLTYDSEAVNAHDVVAKEYVEAVTAEANSALEIFESRLSKPLEVEIRVILVPLKKKAELIKLMDAKLRKLQAI
jgi:hypothetical protein